ncbi:MAG: hypothetical protein H7301_10835 [Cryobacterium sp.]|nr:hypothetical protein [Oligoflexia bacterium]
MKFTVKQILIEQLRRNGAGAAHSPLKLTSLHREQAALKNAHGFLFAVIVTFYSAVAPVWAEESQISRSTSVGESQLPFKKPAPLSSADLPGEVACGLSCRYSRANENLTLQAVYLLKKIKLIDLSIQTGKEGAARTALGGFCANASEEVESCFKRYKDFQRVGLLEIRQAIGRNEDSIARLVHGRKIDGTAEGEALVFQTGADQPAYLPEVPTLKDLETTYLQGNLQPRGGKYSPDDVRKWSQELVLTNPRARTLEFRKETFDANPYGEEKGKSHLHMVNRNEGGVEQTDKAASALYEKSRASIEAYAKDKTISAPENRTVSPGRVKKEDQVSYDAFTQARSLFNSTLAGDLEKDAKSSARKPAAAPKKDPKVAPNPGFTAAPENTELTNRDVNIGGTVRNPAGKYRIYEDDETVKLPPEMKNSRYIRYDIHELFKDTDESTK